MDGMTSFDEVFEAYMRQMLYQLDLKMDEMKDFDARAREYGLGSFFMNGSFPTVLESGIGMFAGGLPCDAYMVFSGSISTAADCLAGLKHVVFDLKKYTIPEIREALLCDFKGYETMQAEMKAAPKFGNDCNDVDLIATEIMKRFCLHTEKYTEKTGFRVLPALIGWEFLQEAYGIAATPDGRNYGGPIAEHFNAAPGNAKNGPTSGMFRTREEGLQLLDSLNRGAAASGLMFLNIGIYDLNQLRDAQVHPEKYPDLIVRVWGFSARFVDLARGMQDHVIARVETTGS